MMDLEDLGEWVLWLLLAVTLVVTVLMALAMTVVAACQVINCVRSRDNQHGGGGGGCSALDELLLRDMGLQDVVAAPAYYSKDGGGEEEEMRESCAICVTAYEPGEPCSVLPACAHMFHKPCVAKWLRSSNTCPLCRATVVRTAAADDDMV